MNKTIKSAVAGVMFTLTAFGISAQESAQGQGVPFPEVERPSVKFEAPAKPHARQNRATKAPMLAPPTGYTVMGYQNVGAYGVDMGVYRLTEEAAQEFVFSDDYTKRNYVLTAGWMRNGRLCAVAEYSIFSIMDFRYLEMDPYTGRIIIDRKIALQDPVTEFYNYLPTYMTAAYIEEDGDLYGYTSNAAGNGYAFFRAEEGDPTKTEVVKEIRASGDEYDQLCVSFCYNPDDGYFYGINRKDKLVRIDKKGDQTEVMALPQEISTRFSTAGMLYNPETKRILWQ